MSTSTSAVDDLLAAADRQWRALDVHRRDRVTLAADLRAELEAADAEGLDPAELLGADPPGSPAGSPRKPAWSGSHRATARCSAWRALAR
jgi:hypothetical protein